jgi:hypothetical protein
MKLWVARDKSGELGLYREKPVWIKEGVRYDWFGAFGCYIWNDKLPEVTFENSPQEVELNLVINGEEK